MKIFILIAGFCSVLFGANYPFTRSINVTTKSTDSAEQLFVIPDAALALCHTDLSDLFVSRGANDIVPRKIKLASGSYLWFPGDTTANTVAYKIKFGGDLYLPNAYAMRPSCVFWGDFSGDPTARVGDLSETADSLKPDNGTPDDTAANTVTPLKSYRFTGQAAWTTPGLNYKNTNMNQLVSLVGTSWTIDAVFSPHAFPYWVVLATLHSNTFGIQIGMSAATTFIDMKVKEYTFSRSLTADSMYALRFTYDRSARALTCYYNGIAIDTQTIAANDTLTYVHGSLAVGADLNARSSFVGNIAHFAIYREALGSNADLYNNLFTEATFNTYGGIVKERGNNAAVSRRFNLGLSPFSF
jgi:hypothetical protein